VNLEQLTEQMAGSQPTPAAGTAATVVLELSLALLAKAVARSGGDGPILALTSQVRALRRRLDGEDDRVETTYAAALDALAAGDREAIGSRVGEALDAVVRLAGTAADVAELAQAVADRCDPVVRPDAAAAAALAASAAVVGAHLAGLNLLAAADERAARARALADAAQASAAAALAT
jgi:hypothetical protein